MSRTIENLIATNALTLDNDRDEGMPFYMFTSMDNIMLVEDDEGNYHVVTEVAYDDTKALAYDYMGREYNLAYGGYASYTQD